MCAPTVDQGDLTKSLYTNRITSNGLSLAQYLAQRAMNRTLRGQEIMDLIMKLVL